MTNNLLYIIYNCLIYSLLAADKNRDDVNGSGNILGKIIENVLCIWYQYWQILVQFFFFFSFFLFVSSDTKYPTQVNKLNFTTDERRTKTGQ